METEREFYNQVCKPEFEQLFTELKEINRRLFVDNGAESVQTKLKNNENDIRDLIDWTVTFKKRIWAVVVALLGSGGLLGVFFWMIKEYISK